jgi:hypothetical protein
VRRPGFFKNCRAMVEEEGDFRYDIIDVEMA